MKKKLIATLVAGAVLSTGLIGLTACGGGLNKGVEVSKDDWAKAFANTYTAENFTIKSSVVEEESATVTVDGKKVNASSKETSEATAYYAKNDNKTYSESKITNKTTNLKEIGEAEEDVDVNYEIKQYGLIEESSAYIAAYTTNEEAGDNKGKWTASVVSVDYMGSPAMLIAMYQFATEENASFTDYKSLPELYDSFKYDGGYYVADLYMSSELMKVTVSINKTDDVYYIVGIQVEGTHEEKDEESGDSYKSTTKSIFNFNDYGKTKVNAPSDATKAIDDYKAQ